MEVLKEIIRPGTYWYLNEATGLPAKFVATPEKIKHFYDSGKQMLAAELSIPVPLEHQQDAKPLTSAEKAAKQLLNNAGFVKDYQIKDNTLFGLLDIPDPKIVAKLPSTIRWTSPWINSFTDGNGKKWDGVISHVALTTRPRITRQQPFPSISAAMSFADSMKDGQQPIMSLSRAGLIAGEGPALKPLYPMAFSLYTGIKLDVNPPTPKKDIKDAPQGKGGDAKTPPDQEAVANGNPNPEETLIDADGDIQVCDVICDLMESMGYPFPEGTTKDNFMERMYSVAMDAIKKKSGDMSQTNQPPSGKPNDTPANPVVQEQPPLYMSLDKVQEEAKKIADPALKAIVEAALSHQTAGQKRLDALVKNAMETAKVKRESRIAKIAKHLPQVARDQLTAQSQAMAFSLGDDGIVKDPMSVTLDILEAGMREIPQLLTTQSALFSEQQHPQEYEGGISADRAKQVADELAKNGTMRTAAPAAA